MAVHYRPGPSSNINQVSNEALIKLDFRMSRYERHLFRLGRTVDFTYVVSNTEWDQKSAPLDARSGIFKVRCMH
jgi:hypothetical protein